eukprot:6206575-Pleurochrysis_carterae.AAC.3
MSPSDTLADVRLRCDRANARSLRCPLSVPKSDPDHDCLPSWIDRVGACNIDNLVREDSLLDSPASELSTPELAMRPFIPLIKPPLTNPFAPSQLQPAECNAHIFDLPQQLGLPACFLDFQLWLDTLLNDLTTMRDASGERHHPRPFVHDQTCQQRVAMFWTCTARSSCL